MKEKKVKKTFLFHPILFGIFPLVSLFASNVNQARPELAYRAFIVSFIGSVLLFLLVSLIIKDTPRAALLSTLFIVLFFSYGQIYAELEKNTILGLSLGHHRLMGPLWAILFFAGSWWILKKGKNTWQLNSLLNAISVFVLIMPVYQIGSFEIRYQQSNTARALAESNEANPTAGSKLTDPKNLPDVYYIILDGYSRADTLRKLYDFDNTDFLKQLKDIGFVIPDCAQSNYARTALSVSSALHMDYLDNFTDVIRKGDPSIDAIVFEDLIKHNPVRQIMNKNGYKLVAFETGYFWNEVTDADYYIIGNNNPLEKVKKGAEITEFEVMFLRTTYFRIFSEAQTAFFSSLTKNIRTPEEKHYDLVLFELDQLAQVPSLPGKKYVYAHIVAPHAPFVISKWGEYSSTGAVNPGYTDEITYLNKRVIEVVKQILATSTTPPVIVIQGDHGWDENYRMQILNAYYLPSGGNKLVYPKITPVNTFRIIFNQYFGENFPLLKDESFMSEDKNPYKFTNIPQTCVGPNGN